MAVRAFIDSDLKLERRLLEYKAQAQGCSLEIDGQLVPVGWDNSAKTP